MTNGEKIQQMFPRKCPHIGFNENFGRIWLMQDGEDFANFTLKWWNAEYRELTINNDLGIDCIDRTELLKAMDTWDKFGYSARYGLERLDKDDKGFVPYVKYDDMVKCIKGLPSVTPQELRKGHWIDMPIGFKCSECQELEHKTTKFCPNCGADMRGEKT